MKVREVLIIHHELITVHGVTKGQNGESFVDMDYQSLVRLLAIQEAMNS